MFLLIIYVELLLKMVIFLDLLGLELNTVKVYYQGILKET